MKKNVLKIITIMLLFTQVILIPGVLVSANVGDDSFTFTFSPSTYHDISNQSLFTTTLAWLPTNQKNSPYSQIVTLTNSGLQIDVYNNAGYLPVEGTKNWIHKAPLYDKNLSPDDDVKSDTFKLTEGNEYVFTVKYKIETLQGLSPSLAIGYSNSATASEQVTALKVWTHKAVTNGFVEQTFSVTATADMNNKYVFICWHDHKKDMEGMKGTRIMVESVTVSMQGDETGNTISEKSVYSFPVNGNVKYKAVFSELPQYGVTVSVNDSSLGNVSSSGGSYNYGDTVTLNATPSGSNIFVCWEENGKEVSTSKNYSFEVKGTHNIKAYFAEKDKYKVIFKDESGMILKVESVEAGHPATGPAVTSKTGYEFVGWNRPFNSITADTVITAIYKQADKLYTVNVSNGKIDGVGVGSTSGNYKFDTFVTVVANNSAAFSYWQNAAGKIVSYEPSYSFYVSDNISLIAVNNGTVQKLPAITINSAMPGSGTVSFVAQCLIPSGTAYTIVEYGVLLSQDNSNPDLGTTGVIRGRAYSKTSLTGQYMITKKDVLPGQVWYGRAYMVYSDGSGNLFTMYSDVLNSAGQ